MNNDKDTKPQSRPNDSIREAMGRLAVQTVATNAQIKKIGSQEPNRLQRILARVVRIGSDD